MTKKSNCTLWNHKTKRALNISNENRVNKSGSVKYLLILQKLVEYDSL